MPELPTSARHITEFFDRHGLLRQQCPRHWALEACQSHPLHRCYHASNDRPVGLSRRHQNANAKSTLQVNQMQREANIRACIERQCIDMHGQLDVQQQRYMRLLFDPIVDFQALMPEDMLDEAFDVSSSSRSGTNKPKSRSATTKWNFMRKGTLSLRLCLSAGGGHRSVPHPESKPAETTSAGILSNDQRSTLLLIFQRYVMRVSGGASSSDQMQRSTWFRFLHHCGILGPEAASVRQKGIEAALPGATRLSAQSFSGATNASRSVSVQLLQPPKQGQPPARSVSVVAEQRAAAPEPPPTKASEGVLDTERKGGVSWSHGSSVFTLYAESTHAPPTMTFSSWVNAVQHVLRGPSFYRTQKEVIANLFGVCLQRCEVRISGGTGGPPSAGPPISGSFCAPPMLTDSGHGSHRPPVSREPTPPGTPRAGSPLGFAKASSKKAASEMSREQALRQFDDVGVLGWQSDLAEEQMCEPEVIQLLHEFEVPLQKLFMIYALREYNGVTAESPGASPKKSAILEIPGGSFPNVCGKGPDSMPDKELTLAVPAGFSPDTVAAAADEASDKNRVATQEEIEDDADSSASSESKIGDVAAEAMDDLADLNTYKRRRSSILSTAMEQENFHAMLHEFGFLPTIVQTHSARQHVEIALARRNANLLSYESFIECLCRIAFVYLSIFGNSVQQVAPSKAKMVWLLTLLRARCRDLHMPDGLGDPRGAAWIKRKHFNLDACDLESLVVWPALNCSVGHSRVKQQIAERGVPRLSVTCLQMT